MNILVIGAGVIGTVYGFQLSLTGNNVTHYIKKNKASVYINKGIKINCLDERKRDKVCHSYNYKPEVITELSNERCFDLIIISASCESLIPILEILKNKINKAIVLVMQNIRPIELAKIDDYLGKGSYILGFPFIAGGEKNNNIINCSIYKKRIFNTMLGTPNGGRNEKLIKVYNLMKEISMRPKITVSIVSYLKVHYVWAAVNAAALIKAGNYRNFVDDQRYLKESYLVMREIWKIYKKDHIYANRMLPTSLYYFPLAFVLPISKKIYNNDLSERVMVGHVSRCKSEIKTMYNDILIELNEKNEMSKRFLSYKQLIENY